MYISAYLSYCQKSSLDFYTQLSDINNLSLHFSRIIITNVLQQVVLLICQYNFAQSHFLIGMNCSYSFNFKEFQGDHWAQNYDVKSFTVGKILTSKDFIFLCNLKELNEWIKDHIKTIPKNYFIWKI